MQASGGGWGEVGSSEAGPRYAKPLAKLPHGRGRRRCHCGCGNWGTHGGYANGVCLTSGCELFVRRWVTDPDGAYRAIVRRESLTCDCGQRIRSDRGMRSHVTGWRHQRWTERHAPADGTAT